MKVNMYDVIILGSGPAGLQAAIHAARARVSVLVLGRLKSSSLYGANVENYCCMDNLTGDDMLTQGRAQAEKFGVHFLEEDSIEININSDDFLVKTESGDIINGKSVIFTLGISKNKLNVKGEREFKGKGISYCVDCDANFFKDRPVAVIGNSSAAAAGALTLNSYTDTVHLVTDELDISKNLERELSNSGVIVHSNIQVEEITGENSVDAIRLSDNSKLDIDGVFVELGAKGAVELAGYMGIEMDDSFKYISANREMETNIPGVFAAGDILGPPFQIAKAVGEGCVAGLNAAKYAKGIV